MKPITESTTEILEAKESSLQLIYSDPENLIITEAGRRQPGSVVSKTPSFAVKKSALSSSSSSSTSLEGEGQKYILLAIDLDAPFVSFSMLAPIIHMLHPDLVLSLTSSERTENSTQDFIPLTPSKSSQGPMVTYIGPGAPPISGDHRYVFLLYEQPDSFDRDHLLEALGISTGGPEKVGFLGRINFDQGVFEKAAGVGKAVAGNWFESK